MDRIVTTLILFICIFTFAAYSEGGKKAFKNIAEFNGKCTRAVYLDKDRTRACKGKVVKIVRTDGRVEIGFYMTGLQTLIFSGGRDQQRSPNDYVLDIDSMRLLVKAESQGTLPVTGKCRIRGDITKASLIHCWAKVNGKRIDYRFRTNKPVIITR